MMRAYTRAREGFGFFDGSASRACLFPRHSVFDSAHLVVTPVIQNLTFSQAPWKPLFSPFPYRVTLRSAAVEALFTSTRATCSQGSAWLHALGSSGVFTASRRVSRYGDRENSPNMPFNRTLRYLEGDKIVEVYLGIGKSKIIEWWAIVWVLAERQETCPRRTAEG